MPADRPPSTTAARPLTEGAVDEALNAALTTVRRNLADFSSWYPDDTTQDGVYRPRRAQNGYGSGENIGWTTCFWPGMLWLAWEQTRDESFRSAGLVQVERFDRRLRDGVDLDTHDLGFLYTLTCVAPWRLLGDERARDAAVLAADHLMTRFLEPAGIVQAWGDLTDPRQRGRAIIDSLMNMPLLYWASEVTGSDHYAHAARRHTEQLEQCIIRPDDTTFHTYYWDVTTGEPLRGATEQGHQDASCWARGQAWGIYGFALNHRYTGQESFVRAATRCADYFLDHLPDDGVAYWDLVFTDESGEERDSSAAAIAVCGLDELATILGPDGDGRRYRDEAQRILANLVERYATGTSRASNALLLHGVYDKPKAVGVDEGTLWGDYFYLEALVRRRDPQWVRYW